MSKTDPATSARGMRILFLSPRYPWPPTRGDQRRVVHLVEGLARSGAEVVLVCFGTGPDPGLRGVRISRVSRGGPASVAANLGHPSPLLPLQVRLFLDGKMHRTVRHELLTLRPHVVHLTLARMGPYAPLRSAAHVHVDFIDSLSLNMRTRAESSAVLGRAAFRAEALLMRRYEAALAARAGSSSVVSERDRGRDTGLEPAAVVPNGVDLDAFPFRDPRSRPPVVAFFGNLGYFHNVEPAQFVASEVLPRLRALVPDARLRIFGARPGPAIRRLASLEGVELRRDVQSVARELHDVAVAALPMFSGSGIKNKVLEAFCTGTPVVTNPLGIQGVSGAQAGVHYLESGDPNAFAERCASLLSDSGERSRLAGHALELVCKRFTWPPQIDALLQLYRAKGKETGDPPPG